MDPQGVQHATQQQQQFAERRSSSIDSDAPRKLSGFTAGQALGLFNLNATSAGGGGHTMRTTPPPTR